MGLRLRAPGLSAAFGGIFICLALATNSALGKEMKATAIDTAEPSKKTLSSEKPTPAGVRLQVLLDRCPSADDLRLIRRFEKGGSGSSGLEFKLPAADAASGGLRWFCA
jgi:hypothetical protein